MGPGPHRESASAAGPNRLNRPAPNGRDHKDEGLFLEALESELVNSEHLEPMHDFQTMVFAGEGARN